MTRPVGDDALIPSERRILDFWDAGMSEAMICAATGYADLTVERTLQRYNGGDDERRWRRRATLGCTAYAAAIVAMVGAPS